MAYKLSKTITLLAIGVASMRQEFLVFREYAIHSTNDNRIHIA